MDPNEKTGPAGFGPAQFIAAERALSYRINFENEATATAPAQRVVVTDQLDADLDWDTFGWTEVGFGDNLITIPVRTQHFQTTMDMTFNNRTFQVEIELSLDSRTGLLTAIFQSIDPATSLPPDVLTGFLPPEDDTGRGQGHMSYTVLPRSGLPTGTEIRNIALITFDVNEPIATNQLDPHDPAAGTDPDKEARNTLDAGAPTSSVDPLPATEVTADFTVSWSGRDDTGGSGIRFFDIYVSDNGGPFVPFLLGTTDTSATFIGADGHTYGFYSVATDNVVNREPTPAAAQAATMVVTNRPPVAGDDSATMDEDAPIAIDVLANDNDPDGDPLTVTAVTVPTHGTATINPDGTITYTPAANFQGSDAFVYTVSDGAGRSDTATVSVLVHNLVDLSGRVFDDKDNDGLYEPGDGDAGIAGVSVELFNQTTGALIATRTTAADGAYLFDVNLGAGTYRVVAAQPAGFLDGRETAGNLGGTVDNTQDSGVIGGIAVGSPGTTADAVDYLFARIRPSQAQGLVWIDLDNDGEVDSGESPIQGVTIELTGQDERGQAVNRSATTDANGIYAFFNLRPSGAAGYTIRELQPAGYVDGFDSVGTVNGVAVGNGSINDTFSAIVLPRPNSTAASYNFGERLDDGGLGSGQTAGIGYWQNKNGQSLIRALNGGETATQLGNWLATTFPNMYGASAGANNLAGKTNAEVAAFYKVLFARTHKTAAGGGPPKLDAEVLATALAVYVTNQTLAGTTASGYGFVVTATGVGTRTFNVGSNGAAFGVANNANVTVLNLLLAVNSRSRNGLLYDLDGDGDANDPLETSYRTMATNVFSGINETGHV